MQARIRWAVSGAVVAVAAVAAAFGVPPMAVATQGQPVIAGQINTATNDTRVENTTVSVPDCGSLPNRGLVGCGTVGLDGRGTNVGVIGLAPGTGVEGSGGTTGVQGSSATTGVMGLHTGTSGVGVQGQTAGVGSGVYGLATGSGVGVFGESTNGTGVTAMGTNGVALNVLGKARFSRSGIVFVAGGKATRGVALAGVTTSSMVLATAQQSANVYVKAVIPSNGSFSIRLTGNAPTGGLKIAYFVLN